MDYVEPSAPPSVRPPKGCSASTTEESVGSPAACVQRRQDGNRFSDLNRLARPFHELRGSVIVRPSNFRGRVLDQKAIFSLSASHTSPLGHPGAKSVCGDPARQNSRFALEFHELLTIDALHGLFAFPVRIRFRVPGSKRSRGNRKSENQNIVRRRWLWHQ